MKFYDKQMVSLSSWICTSLHFRVAAQSNLSSVLLISRQGMLDYITVQLAPRAADELWNGAHQVHISP